ncbi:sigma-70 family RNA polymerase sigma factor [Chitinophaga silvisoli]|uniref:RNA polymerase sigma factor n=1 Tax=Chitinophaga silvisoli TaxID=2291814 RepID=A0A3E1NST2_9BACT|nr:sigma-70 family RNA polymerase sigma factor [Chitinophaga silvisoli]RFM30828.1 hypothetical protein DXN04_32470 [Chitinophaga silvisoli]
MTNDIQIAFYNHISAYLEQLKVDDNIVDDIRQDIFLKAHESIDSLKDHQKIISWLKVITYNTVVDHYRKSKRKVPVIAPNDSLNEGNEHLIKCISSLIQTLPEEQKHVMEAIEVSGIPQVEYARLHHLPLSTVKSRIQRARKKIRETVMNSCFLRTDKYGNVTDYTPPKEIL